MTTDKMPFDPADIAKRLSEGHIVKLGDYITLHLSIGTREKFLVQQCRRCVTESRLPFSSVALTLRMEELALFIFKHQHAEPPS
jgi:hypothetical protein